MNGRQVAVLGSVAASIVGVAWACSVGSPVAYGAAPASTSNVWQTIVGGLMGSGGIVATIVLVLKKLGVQNVDTAVDAVKQILDDYRAGKPLDVAEDTALLTVMMCRARLKDSVGSELATKLSQHIWASDAKVVAK